jgi:hypothetical protein
MTLLLLSAVSASGRLMACTIDRSFFDGDGDGDNNDDDADDDEEDDVDDDKDVKGRLEDCEMPVL